MQAESRRGDLLEPAGQAIMVTVGVGNNYLSDIGEVDTYLGQLCFQGLKCLFIIPAGINEKILTVIG